MLDNSSVPSIVMNSTVAPGLTLKVGLEGLGLLSVAFLGIPGNILAIKILAASHQLDMKTTFRLLVNKIYHCL